MLHFVKGLRLVGFRRNALQKGEISLTLSIIGIVVSLFGIGLGVATVNQSQSPLASAQLIPGDYPYRSVLELRNENGDIINWESGITWENTIHGGTNPGTSAGNVKDPQCTGTCQARLEWNTGSVPFSLRGTTADVTVRLPAGYEVIEPYCESNPRSNCENTIVEAQGTRVSIRKGLRIEKDGHVIYGLVVRGGTTGGAPDPDPDPEPDPQPNPDPDAKGNMEVKVVALNYPNVTRFWHKDHATSRRPASCSRQGPHEQKRPLYLSSFTIRAECSGGGCTVGEQHDVKVNKRTGYANFRDLDPGQYELDIRNVSDRGFKEYDGCKSARWTVEAGKTNQEAIMMLANLPDGVYETETTEKICKDKGGKPNLIENISNNLCYYPEGKGGGGEPGDPEPDPEPEPDPGSGALQCHRLCIYSEGTPTNFKCYEGACPDNRPDCGGNTPKERIDNGNKGCRFAGNACGIPAQEVSCTTGEPIGGRGGQPPAPQPPAPQPPGPGPDPQPDPGPQPQPQETAVYFVPDVSTLEVGETVDVDLYLQNARNITEVDVQVSYDSDTIFIRDFYSRTRGTQVRRGNFPDVEDGKGSQLENIVGDGKVNYHVQLYAPQEPQSGTGIVFRATFKAKKPGTSDLKIDTITITDSNGNKVPAKLYHGALVVEGDVTPEPDPEEGEIFEFTTDRASIVKGSCAVLSWKVRGATAVYYGRDVVSFTGKRQECPEQDTEYTLRTEWEGGATKEKKIAIKVKDGEGTPEPPTPEPIDRACKHIKGTTGHRVLFLGDGFDTYKDLEKYALKAVKDVENTNLGDEGLLNKLTFIGYGDVSKSYDCKIIADPLNREGLTLPYCNYDLFEKPKSDCSADTVVMILNREHKVAVAGLGLSVIPKNMADRATAHELGHAIANLYDEMIYIDAHGQEFHSDEDPVKFNCTGEKDNTCTKWTNNEACLQGCQNRNWFRPSKESIMNQDHPSRNFNAPSIDALRKVLDPSATPEPFSANALVAMGAQYHTALHVQLQQSAKDLLSVQMVEAVESYPIIHDRSYDSLYYTISMLDASGNELYAQQVRSHYIELHHPLLPELKSTINLYLPYSEQTSDIVVTDENGTEVLNINLADYNLASPALAGDLCGNAVCDAAIGENENSCRVDCGAHLAKSERERADLDGNDVVNGNDLNVLLDDEVYQKTDEGDVDGNLETNALDYTLILKWFGSGLGEN